MKLGNRYKISDLTAQTESSDDDFLEVMAQVDFLNKRLNHAVRVLNTETGVEFLWQPKQ